MAKATAERVKEHRERVRSEASAYIAKHKVKTKLDMVRIIALAMQDTLDNVITVKHLNSVVYAFIQIKDILQVAPQREVKYKDTRTLTEKVYRRYYDLTELDSSVFPFQKPMPENVALKIIKEEFPDWEGEISL